MTRNDWRMILDGSVCPLAPVRVPQYLLWEYLAYPVPQYWHLSPKQSLCPTWGRQALELHTVCHKGFFINVSLLKLHILPCQMVKRCCYLGKLRDELSVERTHTKGLSYLLNIHWRWKLAYGINQLVIWLQTLWGNDVTKIFPFLMEKWTLRGFQLQSSMNYPVHH